MSIKQITKKKEISMFDMLTFLKIIIIRIIFGTFIHIHNSFQIYYRLHLLNIDVTYLTFIPIPKFESNL